MTDTHARGTPRNGAELIAAIMQALPKEAL